MGMICVDCAICGFRSLCYENAAGPIGRTEKKVTL